MDKKKAPLPVLVAPEAAKAESWDRPTIAPLQGYYNTCPWISATIFERTGEHYAAPFGVWISCPIVRQSPPPLHCQENCWLE